MLWSVAECFQMQHGVRSINLLVPNVCGPNSADPNKAHAFNALVSKFVKAQAETGNESQSGGRVLRSASGCTRPILHALSLQSFKGKAWLALVSRLMWRKALGLASESWWI